MAALTNNSLLERSIRRYRERRALRHFLDALAYEVYLSQVKIDLSEVDAELPMRRDGFSDRIVQEVLQRMQPTVAELEQRVAGLAERRAGEFRALKEDLQDLRIRLERLAASSADSAEAL